MKKIFTLIFAVSTFTLMNAQSTTRPAYSRGSFWTETILNGPIKDKWKWQLDYQYRRMSDAQNIDGASKNIFKNDYQHVYRPWIHYQLNENVRLSLSPIGFWATYFPSSESGGVEKIQPEYRVCPQLTLTNKIGKVTIDQRYRYEYRILGDKVAYNQDDFFGYQQGAQYGSAGEKSRMRYFVRATMPLGNHQKIENKTFYLIAWNELFLQFGKNIPNDQLWNQNRTFCLLGYKPTMRIPMRFELGYGLQYSQKFKSNYTNGVTSQSVNALERNNILQVYVIFEDFNSIFKSKKN